MKPRSRVLLLILIMTCIVIIIEVVSIHLLQKTAISEERDRLREAAQSQARLIESVAAFDQKYSYNYPFGATEATLSQIIQAHSKYNGFGQTGEFTLGKKENDTIVFLLNHRHFDLDNPKPVAFNSNLAEPMRLALQGKSGTIIDLDYRGKLVLAAYEPVGVLNLGIVAKIDLSEVKAPFTRAGIISGLVAILLIIVGVFIFFKLTNPILNKLQETVTNLEHALDEVNTLRGIVPICSYCKKIRDDDGYWSQVEIYMKKRTDIDFSHSICPDCMKEHYPDFYEGVEKENL